MPKRRKKSLEFNRIKSFRSMDKDYKIIWKKPPGAQGLCFRPDFPNPRIYINPKQSQLNLMKTAADEITHSVLFAIDNEWVGYISHHIGEFLYEMGFRLQKVDKKCKKR